MSAAPPTYKELIARIESRLLPMPAATRPRIGDRDLNPDWPAEKQRLTPLKDAAVLIPIIARPVPAILFTERAAHLAAHAGQVSFPGGRVQAEDRDIVDTALRETEEEVGLERAFVTILGHLEPYETGTGFAIQPVVGLVNPDFALAINYGEVAQVFEAPLPFLLDPANVKRHSAVWQGRERSYYALDYGPHYIWGATAGILVALHRRLGLIP